MSTAILKLSEDGKLQQIHDKWFCNLSCPGERIINAKINQLHLISFWGLYILSGAMALIALLVFLLRMVRQFVRYKRREMNSASSSSISSSSHCSHIVFNFFNFIDEKEEAIKKMFAQFENRRTDASSET
ncbi:hypothetical protein SLEP1_g24354 [Rubroshorea leprosula]|nr:hypothetical protein SLEP1_g24354 [Rubroshorea leprosula]